MVRPVLLPEDQPSGGAPFETGQTRGAPLTGFYRCTFRFPPTAAGCSWGPLSTSWRRAALRGHRFLREESGGKEGPKRGSFDSSPLWKPPFNDQRAGPRPYPLETHPGLSNFSQVTCALHFVAGRRFVPAPVAPCPEGRHEVRPAGDRTKGGQPWGVSKEGQPQLPLFGRWGMGSRGRANRNALSLVVLGGSGGPFLTPRMVPQVLPANWWEKESTATKSRQRMPPEKYVPHFLYKALSLGYNIGKCALKTGGVL